MSLSKSFLLAIGIIVCCGEPSLSKPSTSIEQSMINSPCGIQVSNSPNARIEGGRCLNYYYFTPASDVVNSGQSGQLEPSRGRGATELPVYSITETQRRGRPATELEVQPIIFRSGYRP